jgi:hypothetical protein
MKKFSTAAALLLALATALPGLSSASEHGADSARCAFLPNAPDQHTVVRGDTLWGISGKFLQHAWCWPQVWGMNREQIRDPHWIYPGQTVYLDRVAGRLRLGAAGGANAGGIPTVRMSPGIRSQALGHDAVPAIPASVIEPFLSQPLVVAEGELQSAPRIVATQENRVLLSKDDAAFALGDLQGGTTFQGFRPGTPLRDPETRNVIGYEAVYLGTLKLESLGRGADEAHTLRVVSLKQEMEIGDRLLPIPATPLLNYVPRPPEQPVAARIVSVYGGVTHAGQNQIVTVNRGSKDGLAIGNVLELYRFGGVVVDRTASPPPSWFRPAAMVKLPDHKYGSLFIFRVFDGISYGLVMQVTDSVEIGDIARSPE